jgi:hypothetical protein
VPCRPGRLQLSGGDCAPDSLLIAAERSGGIGDGEICAGLAASVFVIIGLGRRWPGGCVQPLGETVDYTISDRVDVGVGERAAGLPVDV